MFASIEEVYGPEFGRSCQRPDLFGQDQRQMTDKQPFIKTRYNLANSGEADVPLIYPGTNDVNMQVPGKPNVYTVRSLPQMPTTQRSVVESFEPRSESLNCSQIQMHLSQCSMCRQRTSQDLLWWFWTFLVILVLLITIIEIIRWIAPSSWIAPSNWITPSNSFLPIAPSAIR